MQMRITASLFKVMRLGLVLVLFAHSPQSRTQKVLATCAAVARAPKMNTKKSIFVLQRMIMLMLPIDGEEPSKETFSYFNKILAQPAKIVEHSDEVMS
jgi:hypothetical protein